MLAKTAETSEVVVKFSAIYLEILPGFFGVYPTVLSQACLYHKVCKVLHILNQMAAHCPSELAELKIG
jgi:hypothetical protein